MFASFNLLTSAGKELQANWGAWFRMSATMAILVALVKFVFPWVIPYEFFELWRTTGSVGEWLTASWPILVWAVGFTFLISALTRNKRSENREAETHLLRGLWLSLRAGVMEEVVFRWLMFMWSFAVVVFFDFVLGGFIFGKGLIWLINVYFLIPVADFTSFGLLSHVLADSQAWVTASAIVSANALFRNGHKYQGLFGMINSWFIGLYMFYLLLQYGLVAAIVVHFVYDVLIFVIRYIDQVQERARGVDNGSD